MRLFSAVLVAACLSFASQGQAAVSLITFEGSGFNVQSGFAGGNTLAQNTLANDFFNKPYSVTFQYDSTTPLVDGKFAASVVSATVNGHSDYFAGYDVFVTQFQAPNNFNWDVMNFVVSKDEVIGPSTFNRQVYFTIVDNEGGLFASPSALPGLIDPTILNQKNGQVWLNNGGYSLSGGVGSVTTQVAQSAGPAAVPEPAAWALMMIGFGGVGATLRARRRACAVSA